MNFIQNGGTMPKHLKKYFCDIISFNDAKRHCNLKCFKWMNACVYKFYPILNFL